MKLPYIAGSSAAFLSMPAPWALQGNGVWSEVCGCADAPLVNVSQGLTGTSIPQAGNPPSMLW